MYGRAPKSAGVIRVQPGVVAGDMVLPAFFYGNNRLLRE
jgi:hypothetical protein